MSQNGKKLYDDFEVDGVVAHFGILTDDDDLSAPRPEPGEEPVGEEPVPAPSPVKADSREEDPLFGGWEDLMPAAAVSEQPAPLPEDFTEPSAGEEAEPEAIRPEEDTGELEAFLERERRLPPFLERIAHVFQRSVPPAVTDDPEPAPGEEPDPPQAPQHSPVSVADVVASTVDAVLDERKADQRKYEVQRQRNRKEQEKIHRSDSSHAADTEDFSAPEPSLAEATVRQKRLFLRLRKRAVTGTVLTVLAWLPYLAQRFYPQLPYLEYGAYFSAGMLALVCIFAAPVFVAGFGRRQINCFTLVSVSAVVTLLDALLPIAGRCSAPAMTGISALAMTLAVWGECWRSGALREGFRLVALGQPAYMVDLTEHGAVKERGRGESFYNRTVKEDSATMWQRLLLPVVLLGSLVFALLSSVSQGDGQNFLWCWSAILNTGCALSLPFVYSLPYYRLARRMNKSGSALAGYYGAKQLSYSKELLICDQDLFPPGTIRLEGVKVISEDRRKVASYAGSLAIAYDCGWTPLLRSYLQSEGGRREHLEHFHVHEEGGISASIRGETAILGTATLLRRMSVRLPKSLERRHALFLAVDGELVAIFGLKYEASDAVGWALHAMRRNGLTPLLVTKDPNLTPRFLKKLFGTDGGALLLDLNERLNLAPLRQESSIRPNALLYREGLAPYMEAVAGSKRLCRAVRWGNVITLFGSVCGTLLAYYLLFMDRTAALNPLQLLLFLALWAVPVLVLAWNGDKL